MRPTILDLTSLPKKLDGSLFQSRRGFLLTIAGAAIALPITTLLRNRWWQEEEFYVTSAADSDNRYSITVLDRSGATRFSLPVAERCHGIATSPVNNQRIVVFPRRPGHMAYEVDLGEGRVRHSFSCSDGRFFYGHGCYSLDGNFLFASENDYENGRGIITIRETDSFKVVGEVASFGIGPHELMICPDGKTLVVANGGILERPEIGDGREKLNVATMQPSLVYIDLAQARLMAEFRLADRLLSIRHLAFTTPSGNEPPQVAIALQYEGSSANVPSLVAFHDGRNELQLGEAPSDFGGKMRGFALSICANKRHGIVAVSCPKGNELTFWDSRKHSLVKTIPLMDASGISLTEDESCFVATSGTGEIIHVDAATLTTNKSTLVENHLWDNHLSAPIRRV